MSGRIEKASGSAGAKKRKINGEKASDSDPTLGDNQPKPEDTILENVAKKPKTIESGSSRNVTPPTKAPKTICDLNIFCMESLMMYLSVRDQLKFAASNIWLGKMYKMYAQRRYKYINEWITHSVDDVDLQYLLELVNVHVLSYESPLRPGSDAERNLWMVRSYCPVLRHLRMTIRSPRWHDLSQLKNLQSLEVYLNFGKPETYRNFVVNLKELPCLRRLYLEAPGYSGDGLHVLDRLETLEVGAQPGLDAQYLAICCLKMKNLRYLNMGCFIDNLTAENFRVIVKNCPKLEKFAFGERLLARNVPYEIVGQLPRLKHLKLWHSDSLRPGFIEGLIQRTEDMTPLESLVLIGYDLQVEQVEHICGITSLRELAVTTERVPVNAMLQVNGLEDLKLDVPGLTNDDLLALLKGLPHLRKLTALNCGQVNSALVSDASKFFKELRDNREMVKIYLKGSAVNWN
ncbi:hypothetical protein KR009_003492, partial [Drosophila setifemur]